MIAHKGLSEGRWQELSLMEQLANVGSEVIRALKWCAKNEEYSRLAFYRALELLQYTKQDPKNKGSLKEICRVYEFLVDFFEGENIYKSTSESFEKYFTQFNILVSIRKGR